jgi:hypothetical protein
MFTLCFMMGSYSHVWNIPKMWSLIQLPPSPLFWKCFHSRAFPTLIISIFSKIFNNCQDNTYCIVVRKFDWTCSPKTSTYIKELGFFQCKSCVSVCPSVRPVSYWLELRVMGIIQCQGYPSVSWVSLSVRFVCEETRVPQCNG